jgi:H+/Cl- antiporter ClcA
MDILNRIRTYLKAKFDSIANEKLKKNFLIALPYWIGAFATGFVAVLYAKLFAWAEDGTVLLYEHAPWTLFIITPLCFCLAWLLVHKLSPFARGSGIPQVTAAIELTNSKHNIVVNKLLSLRVIIIKTISSLIMIFGGGVVGREGPTIQISASIFKKINDLLPEWYPKISKQNMIITGAAAGLSSAFNTPLGGIVFAIEELSKKHFNLFKSALLTGVIIAGLTALNILGPYLYLGYPKTSNIGIGIILVIIPIAIITSLTGSGMGRAILFIFQKKKKLNKTAHNIIYTLLCGLIIAALAVFIDTRALGSGKEIMTTALFSDNKYLEWYVPFLRVIGSVVSFSTGASGGIFAPSLSAGASIGAVISGWFSLSGTETNLIVLCGMVGVLTGITRSPFTSSILVIEMTNEHVIIFYLMITALIANVIASMINRTSFYDCMKEQYIDELHQCEKEEQDLIIEKEKKRVGE